MAISYLTRFPSLIDENNGHVAYLRGHSKQDKGAESSRTGLNEWTYYGPVLPETARHLQKRGVNAEVWQRDGRYEWKYMRNHINQIHKTDPYDLVTMGHLNCFNTRARGAEVLCHYKSELGLIAGEFLLARIVKLFGGPNRGVKKLSPGIRAYGMTSTLVPVALIAEAGFIDNETDEKALMEMRDLYDEAIVMGTIDFLEYKGIEIHS